MTDIATIGVR